MQPVSPQSEGSRRRLLPRPGEDYGRAGAIVDHATLNRPAVECAPLIAARAQAGTPPFYRIRKLRCGSVRRVAREVSLGPSVKLV